MDWWWCKNCGANIMIDICKLKYPSDVRPVNHVENVLCDVCENIYEKQVKK